MNETKKDVSPIVHELVDEVMNKSNSLARVDALDFYAVMAAVCWHMIQGNVSEKDAEYMKTRILAGDFLEVITAGKH